MNFFSLVALFIVVLLALAAAGIAVFTLYATIIGLAMGAPYVRSKKEKIARVIEFSKITTQDTVVDLGSGDGSLVLAASAAGAAAAVGVEMNPLLVWYSRMRIRRAGLNSRARVRRGNFYHFSLREADVVLLYLLPGTVAKLREKMDRELKHGARVVSNAFPIPGWRAREEKSGVYLYRVPAHE